MELPGIAFILAVLYVALYTSVGEFTVILLIRLTRDVPFLLYCIFVQQNCDGLWHLLTCLRSIVHFHTLRFYIHEPPP